MIAYKPKWRNTVADDIALRQTYSDKLLITQQMLATCASLGALQSCHKKTGKTENNWRDDRNRYQSLIAALDKKIATDSATATAGEKVKIQQAITQQNINAADLTAAQTSTQNTTKYILVGAAVIAVIVGGIFLVKKLRKGK